MAAGKFSGVIQSVEGKKKEIVKVMKLITNGECAFADTATANNALMSQTINSMTRAINDFDSNRKHQKMLPKQIHQRPKHMSSMSLFTLFSFASKLTMPQYRVEKNMSYTDHMVNKFKEINEHYDGTVNKCIYFLISQN